MSKPEGSTSARIMKVIAKAIKGVGKMLMALLVKLGLSPVGALIILAAAVIGIVGALGIVRSSRIDSKTTALGLKNIGEMATQAAYFTNVQVIDNNQKLLGMDLPLTQTKIIFSYDGAIKAGLNFEDVQVSVNEESHTIEVMLPEIKILSLEIDEKSMKIYHEDKSVFTPLNMADIQKSMEELRKEATETAIENGLFTNARANAEELMKGFLAGIFDLKKFNLQFR